MPKITKIVSSFAASLLLDVLSKLTLIFLLSLAVIYLANKREIKVTIQTSTKAGKRNFENDQ